MTELWFLENVFQKIIAESFFGPWIYSWKSTSIVLFILTIFQKSPWKNIHKTKKSALWGLEEYSQKYTKVAVLIHEKILGSLIRSSVGHLKQFLNFKLKNPMVQEKNIPSWLFLWSLKIYSYKNYFDSSFKTAPKTLVTLLFFEPIFLQHKLNPLFGALKIFSENKIKN